MQRLIAIGDCWLIGAELLVKVPLARLKQSETAVKVASQRLKQLKVAVKAHAERIN